MGSRAFIGFMDDAEDNRVTEDQDEGRQRQEKIGARLHDE
jgi:hypothetical protein